MTIKKAFIENFKNELQDLNFQLKGKVFHRVVNNELVELISYTTFRNKRFTIEFEIIPFCCGYEITNFFDGIRVGALIGNEPMAEWDNDENVFNNMKLALDFCKINLLPYLKAIVNLNTYIKCMNEIYNKWWHYSKGIPLAYNFVYYPNLKLHNFDIAKKSRMAVLQQNENAFKSNGFATNEQMRDYLEIKKEFKYVCNAIDNNDLSAIDKYIEEKENFSRTTYNENFL